MSQDNFQKKRIGVQLEKPEWHPHLKFMPQTILEKNGLRFGFWSENANNNNEWGFIQNEFLEYLRTWKKFHVLIAGETMEGKGVFLENLAEFYWEGYLKGENKKYTDLDHPEREKICLIDVSGKNYEGCFWAKKYKCILVYPQLLKPRKTSTNPNIEEVKLNKKNTWQKLIKKAAREKKILILMCYDPLEPSYLRAEAKLFKILSDDLTLGKIKKYALCREISFIGYKQGLTKVSMDTNVLDTKRWFLKLIRTGRHNQALVFSDAQRSKDIDDNLGDNVALKVFKRTNGYVGNYPKYIQDAIKTLAKNQAIFEFRGKIFTCTIRYNEWHKKEEDSIESLGIYPTIVDLANFNKWKENQYIDWVSENWTNYYNRLVIGRRRHIQNEENSKLCNFEIADILGIEGKTIIRGGIIIDNPYLVYGEVKFRNSERHPKIEKAEVQKTIQDLFTKNILWSIEDNKYYWTIDNQMANALNWQIGDSKKEIKIPCKVVMVTQNGATQGAKALIDKHHINIELIKLPESFYE